MKIMESTEHNIHVMLHLDNSQEKKFKSLILSLVIVMLCQTCVLAEEVDTILQEETTIENVESIVVDPAILTYKEVV